MRITIVTDAWLPQINGVVTTMRKTIDILENKGHTITVIHPSLFKTFATPGYSEIRLAVDLWNVGKKISDSEPECLHISTEGPLGLAAKLWADRRGVPYSTSYHTRFPEYVEEQWGLPASISYSYMRWFHKRSKSVMVNTNSMSELLKGKGFHNLKMWGRGVDTTIYYPDGPQPEVLNGLKAPIWLNVGRVSVEKNLEEFYKVDVPGTKVQVGDGPARADLQARYPDVIFVGAKKGEELASFYRAADVFVFPSETDTFGLVMLESLASGVPVAAKPAPGPIDVIQNGVTGFVDKSLNNAMLNTLAVDRSYCRTWALTQSWQACTTQFENNLCPINDLRDDHDSTILGQVEP